MNDNYKQKTISANLEESLAEVRQIANNSSDILINRLVIGNISCAVLGCEGMLSTAIMTDLIIKPLTEIPMQLDSENLFQHIQNHLLLSLDRPVVRNYKDFFKLLYSGFAILFAEGQNKALAFGVQGYDKRSIGEPSGEKNILGAQEGFIETIRTNMSLIRRRMKTPLLKFEISQIGNLSQTDICLCYMTDRVPAQLLQQVKKKLASVKLDTVLSTGYLESFLEKCRGSLFDSVSLTQRPDVLCSKLLEGRIALLIDGTPFVIVIPKLFVENFQTLDDYNDKPYYATFSRWIKYLGFLLAILLPALYIAVCMHHPELLNSTLVLILTQAEQKAPLSLPVETIFVLLMYEIIREAGLRLPKSVGGAVSIVAGLIIGDSAVSSGLISTPMLTMVAISVIAGFITPDLNPVITVLRLAFIITGGLWGLFGIGLLGMIVLFNLCATENFGFPVTAPLAPFIPKSMRDVATRVNFQQMQSGNFTVEEYHEQNS
ncbi:MAG: spore germination protein [Oscillospiraceae bacterium]|nr:spore germination protein [Ruminococcus sp.]MDE6707811.1 spore germination protein [Oscillospiraceae bacterium]